MMKAETQTAPPTNGIDASANTFKAGFLSPVPSKQVHSACALAKATEGPVLDPRRNIAVGPEAELYATRRVLRALMFELEHQIQSHAVDTARVLLAVKRYEMANSVLLAAKGGLGQLKQDMTALSNQLRKAQERLRSAVGYLTNLRERTDLSMLFVHSDLKICFFTPAAPSEFLVVLAAVGRPLADLAEHRENGNLAADGPSVLDARKAIERNVATAEGLQVLRRTQHGSAESGRAGNVVITLVGIIEDKHLYGACAIAELARGAITRIAGGTISQDPGQIVGAERDRAQARSAAQARFSKLTQRQRAIMSQVLEGKPNKIIAADLRLNQRTVENHRAAVMHKTGTTSLPELVRLAILADISAM